MANAHRQQERVLRQLIRVTEYMECELQFRQTPLPNLCRNAAQVVSGELRNVLLALEQELEMGCCAEVSQCMARVLEKNHGCSPALRPHLEELGQRLGTFDLTGQLQGLRSLRTGCENAWKQLSDNRENRLRSYQTLGLCTGAALAVLLL